MDKNEWPLCPAVAMQVEGLRYYQPLLLHRTLFTKRGYSHGDIQILIEL